MKTENKKTNPQREQENKHLNSILKKVKVAKSVVSGDLDKLGEANVERLKELREGESASVEYGDFDVFLEQLHQQDLTFNVKDKFRMLEEFEYLLKEPYFSRIDLEDQESKKVDAIYIGKFGYTEDVPIITDWRTKIASVYYRYRYPQKNVSYDTELGKITKNLKLKRTFEIDNGKLIKYYNNDIQLDENSIIIEKIEGRTGGVLEDIVQTIQTSQLDIIEADPRQVCIVQGCVGSGKSTVAIHKLAHIFFNYPKIIRPERSVLIAKNQILVGYLSTLFSKLGLFNVTYKTLRELMVHFVFREEMGISIDLGEDMDTSSFNLSKIKELKEKVGQIHDMYESKINDVFSDEENVSFGGYKYAKNLTPFENLNEIIVDLEETLMDQKEFLNKHPDSPQLWFYKDNVKLLRKMIKALYKLRMDVRTREIKKLVKYFGVDLNKKLNYIQTLIFIYAFSELVGLSKFPKFEYCVVDEGQDFSVLEYLVLSKFVLRGRFAIFGDLNQSLESDGISVWNDIKEVIFEAKEASVFELDTNYRSTKPIIDLANKILSPFTPNYLPKSINRKGVDPIIKTFDDQNDVLKELKDSLSVDIEKVDKSIGIIDMTGKYSEEVLRILKEKRVKKDKIITLNSRSRVRYIPKGVYVMNFEDCKGLEFAKVYVLGANLDKIKSIEEARKVFVATTRAMNELCVYGIK